MSRHQPTPRCALGKEEQSALDWLLWINQGSFIRTIPSCFQAASN